MRVRINNMTEARRLSEAVNRCSCEVEAISGSKTCNAKSWLGLLTLDLNNEIELRFNCDAIDVDKFVNIVMDRF